jgi:hypothetical protein
MIAVLVYKELVEKSMEIGCWFLDIGFWIPFGLNIDYCRLPIAD